MSKTIKYCPKCGFETDNERDFFCPLCVDTDEPVKLEIKPEEAAASFSSPVSEPIETEEEKNDAFSQVPSPKPEDDLESANSSQERNGDSGASKQVRQPTPEYVSDAQRLQMESIRRMEAKKLQFQKEDFIVQYTNYLGDIDKVCPSIVTRATFREWLHEDSDFADLFEDAKRKVEILLAEKAKRDAEVKGLKKLFLELYKSNNCVKKNTCNNAHIDIADLDEWLDSDPVFDKQVKAIKKEYDEEQAVIRRMRRRARIRKAIAFLIALILLGFIGYKVYSHKQVERANDALVTQHDDLLRSFDEAVSKVHLDDDGVEAIERVEGIILDIKSFEKSHGDLVESRYPALQAQLSELCDNLIDYYKRKKSSLELDPEKNAEVSEKYRGLEERVTIIKAKI